MRRVSAKVAVIAFVAGAMCGAFFLSGSAAVAQDPPAPTDVVRARSFVLVDAAGRECARLQAPDQGTIGLVILDDVGKALIEIGIMPDKSSPGKFKGMKVNDGTSETYFGGGIGIYGAGDKLRFGFGFTDEGNGGMTWCDEQGRERVSLGMPPRGGYSLSIKDAGGEVLWRAP